MTLLLKEMSWMGICCKLPYSYYTASRYPSNQIIEEKCREVHDLLSEI
jgi:hypothetical protein